ncbi:MAG: M23 family metallopeptidase [Bacillota bacterium]|nr:M23 family metallopeptidase [Bacillota bacterium]
MISVPLKKEMRPRRAGAVWYAYVVFLIISIVPLWGALDYYIQQTGNFYSVYVNDVEIGMLSDADILDDMLITLQDEASTFYGRPVIPVEKVSVEQVHRPFDEENSEKVFSQLRHLLSYKVEARMITVNGKEILPVASEEDVEKVLELVAVAYLPTSSNVFLEAVELGENLSSEIYYTYPEELYDVETVAAILLRGTDRKEIYLVSRGDCLSTIARDYNLSVADLKDANPQIDGDLIRVGDEISLVVPEPIVNVITIERMVVEERIPFKIEYTYDSNMWRIQTRVDKPGVFGTREVVYQITRENGVEIDRKKVMETVVKEPEAQIIARGTSDIPSRGTGSFQWPVAGGGSISSGYGWRSGGFHAGVDIAARTGTSVLAADSGVVVFVGRDGGYGLLVVIYHGHYYTRYGHNSQNLVSNGQAVNKGQVIAKIGSTGRSTGPHLHFEIRTGSMHGPTLNPLNFFSP